MQLGVGLDRLRRVAAAIAAHVGRERPKSGARQRRQLMPPGIPGLRPAVTEHDRRPLAHLGHMQADAVCLDDAVLGRVHRELPCVCVTREELSISGHVRWIRDPRGFDPKTRMPGTGFSWQEARDIAAYLGLHSIGALALAPPTKRCAAAMASKEISTDFHSSRLRLHAPKAGRSYNVRAPCGESSWVSWCFCARRPRARSRPGSIPIVPASHARAGGPFISIVRIVMRPTASRSRKA